jgi:carboxyl-terminal processing protease
MTMPLRLRRVAASFVVAGSTAVFLISCQSVSDADRATAPEAARLALFQDVMRRAERSYVEPVSGDKLTTNALKGALNGLDPHSDYMDEREYRAMLSDTQGEFGGLGMELTVDHGMPKVISPIEDTPAARAGIQPGDLIPSIDGQSTEKLTLRDVVDKLRGQVGTSVKLSILRGEQAPFDVKLTRAIIQVVSVKSHLEADKIGYARITTFGEKTQTELLEAIALSKRQAGGRLNGFVLDLRNDPGGLLDAAVDVSGDFMNGGTVVTIRGRESTEDHAYSAPERGDRLEGIPVVVLINGGSASASEIVAGALQDSKRATLMGTRSFGKGSVQTIIPLHGQGAMRLTTARYYTPSGRSIQDNGIAPDIRLGVPKDVQIANGVLLHEGDLRGALKNTGSLDGKPAATPSAQGNDAGEVEDVMINPLLIGTDKDPQLAAALKLLRTKVPHSS